MAPPSERIANWSLVISRVLFGLGAFVSMIALLDLVGTIHDQNQERVCFFDLTTETDRIDSEIAATQGRIFEAAVLRPSPTENGRTREIQDLANHLHDLLEDRTAAFVRRDNASERCK